MSPIWARRRNYIQWSQLWTTREWNIRGRSVYEPTTARWCEVENPKPSKIRQQAEEEHHLQQWHNKLLGQPKFCSEAKFFQALWFQTLRHQQRQRRCTSCGLLHFNRRQITKLSAQGNKEEWSSGLCDKLCRRLLWEEERLSTSAFAQCEICKPVDHIANEEVCRDR